MCSTCGRSPESACRCSTPKRCCSSTTATARSANTTSRWISACVPTTICASPDSIAARAFFPPPLPVSSTDRTPSSEQRLSTVRKCCSASVSVGTISAPCRPASTARRSAYSATTVFPDPTSPWSSRCIGRSRSRSPSISAIACSWCLVNANGSAARYRATNSPGGGSGRPGSPSTRVRSTASWRATSSSKASRRRAVSASSRSSGKWIAARASRRIGSSVSAGSGSSTSYPCSSSAERTSSRSRDDGTCSLAR